jgi:hypothetical protein
LIVIVPPSGSRIRCWLLNHRMDQYPHAGQAYAAGAAVSADAYLHIAMRT